MNRIILNEANEIMRYCKILGISFRKSDGKVVEEICDVIEGH